MRIKEKANDSSLSHEIGDNLTVSSRNNEERKRHHAESVKSDTNKRGKMLFLELNHFFNF